MSTGSNMQADIAVLTVIPEELKWALKTFGIRLNKDRRKVESGTIYWHGLVSSRISQREYNVVVTCIGYAGNYDCAAATSDVINEYGPKVVLLMGIAAGLRDKVKIGEVVLSERVVAYETAAIDTGEGGKEEIIPRGDMRRIEHTIEQDVANYLASLSLSRVERKFRSRALEGTYPTPSEGKEEEYQNHVSTEAKIKTATIATGEKLLRHPGKLYALRRGTHGRIEVGEMEAAGLLSACRRHGLPWLVVRGISDFGNSFKDDRFHEFAAKMAAVATRDFIAHGLDLKTRPPVEDQWKHRNVELAEKTYFGYRTKRVPLIDSPELINHLEVRHSCSAFQLGGKAFPVTVVWKNEDRTVDPDSILGEFDQTPPAALPRSPVLRPAEYVKARAFIKSKYEIGPIKYEGIDYRMTRIDVSTDPPRIHGAYGLYYDNILTQYAMEWELKKPLLKGYNNAIDALTTLGTLPLREAIEAERNPLLDGGGRCAAITVSTLMVFNRRQGGFYCLIRRRSADVGVSPGMLHVVPAGMFEAKNLEDRWSVEMNVWRELLEEVYDEKEQQGTGTPEFEDYIRRKSPIALLIEMIDLGSAEFSVTGICCDLLNLRPEICTVLFVKDPVFCEARRMALNWEYVREGPAGKFAVRWENINEVVETEGGSGGIVASGAVCLGLGRDWVRRRHGI